MKLPTWLLTSLAGSPPATGDNHGFPGTLQIGGMEAMTWQIGERPTGRQRGMEEFSLVDLSS